MKKSKDLIIYTDGGARGNPGPAAIGAVVGEKEYGEAIGVTTNNVAEYKALINALKKTKQILGKAKARQSRVECRMDSELLMKQLTGQYKIKEKGLQPLFIEIWNLKQDFGEVAFIHVPRAGNKRADKLVNKALDTLSI